MNEEVMENILYQEEVYLIQGAIFEVYKEIGIGFLESVYQECLEKEFKNRGIPFSSQKKIQIYYKGEELIQYFIPDFVCYDKIIVEIKAVKEIGKEHKAQLFNYLKITNLRLGLIVNFHNYPKVKIERVIL